MKALMMDAVETLVYRDAPEPSPADGDAVLRLEACGICGSDMHAYLGHDDRRPAPLILGHEAAGVEEGTGARYTVNPLVTCGECEACKAGRDNLCPDRQIISLPPREGGFAEMLAMPRSNLIAVPDGFALDKAALAEPIACGWHGVKLARRMAQKPIEDSCCRVIGGGAIGLGAALSLKAQGAREIWVAETNAIRHPLLKAAGDFRVYDPQYEAGPQSADIVIDGVGYAATRAAACAVTKPGGVIVHIGLGSGEGGVDMRRLTLQEIAIVGAYTYTMQDFRETAAAMFDGGLGALDWTELRPLSKGAQAFSDIRAGKVAAPKIVLKP